MEIYKDWFYDRLMYLCRSRLAGSLRYQYTSHRPGEVEFYVGHNDAAIAFIQKGGVDWRYTFVVMDGDTEVRVLDESGMPTDPFITYCGGPATDPDTSTVAGLLSVVAALELRIVSLENNVDIL